MDDKNLLNVNELSKVDALFIQQIAKLNSIYLKQLLLLARIAIGISFVAVLLLLVLILR